MPANDTYWYNLKKMHVVFAASAAGLFAVTIWMMWADHHDEWRQYQTLFDRIEETRLADQIEADETDAYYARLDELETKLAEANATYLEEKGDIEDDIKQKAYELDLVERDTRAQRAVRDKARADYDLAIRDERTEDAEALKEIFDAEQAEVDALELDVQVKTAALDEAKQRQKDLKNEVLKIEAEIAELTKEVDRLETTKNKIAPESAFSAAKRKVMQWPIIDGFNSPHKIKQVWLPDLKITLGMASTARFDRCQTCHLGIDRVESGNVPTFPHGEDIPATAHADKEKVQKWVDENEYPHPYSTHPNPDLYLTASSPHPTQQFGCTICHDGQGSGTSFDNVQHTPNDPHQHEHWEEKYHYHPNHFWEYPMRPERFRESTCVKCHHSVVELETSPQFGNSAPKLVKGYHTIEQFGCFGCHEIHGKDGDESIGPDLRLEPNHYAIGLAIASASNDLLDDGDSENGADNRLRQIRELANEVADAPEDSGAARKTLQQFVLADKGLESPLFDSRIHGLAEDLGDVDNPGVYRKVGPSLRHVAAKTTQGWLESWTSMPKDFRPTTRMPQFFHLTNQEDDLAKAYQPVQIAAIGHYLLAKSQNVDLLKPEAGYQPDAERGKQLFAERGCLACHSHKDFPDIKMDFGPNLDKVYAKVKAGDDGFNWLYSWIRDPQRYHKRSKMPNLFLEASHDAGKAKIDPAADIAAYLLKERGTDEGKAEYEKYQDTIKVDEAKYEDEAVLDRLVSLNLGQVLTNAQRKTFFESRIYPFEAKQIKGDEIELVHDGKPNDQEWRDMKLSYVGRKTISQNGCFGCHDIPGFEAAKPIATVLQDWGAKDTSRLAFEHITEFLHHHNAPGSDSTLTEQAEDAIKRANAGEFKSEEEEKEALSKAFYYDSILHHGRPGFFWQKLRQPRSYDYKKTETKRYDERLRMPKFPFDEDQIEAIATFVLGLTAEPPAEKYLFKPQGAKLARYQGELLLHKYNCTSCHMVEMPEVRHAVERDDEDTPSTYTDYVGMTKEDIINWFTENREEILDGSLASFPSDVRLVETLAKQFELGVGIKEIAELANVTDNAAATDAKFQKNLREWFGNHPEVLLSGALAPDELPSGVLKLLKLKPPHNGVVKETAGDGDAVVRFHGLLASPPDLGAPPEEQYYGYKLWETLDVGGRIFLPGKNISFTAPDLVSSNDGRGGAFTKWLVNRLWVKLRANETDSSVIPKARQSSPPPLYTEGLKVQTPWLFSFLKNPEVIRHETVLRMPRFNMSNAEAKALANYFPAVDDTEYPYQEIPEQEEAYALKMNEFYREKFANELKDHDEYLPRTWHMLGKNQLCMTCHSVMGREFKAPDPTQVTHGPDLDSRVQARLRPDWLEVWLSKPSWITPYTGMPAPHTKPQAGYFDFGPELPLKTKELQTKALRDALMNYNKMLQKEGLIEPPPLEAATPALGN